MYEKWYKMIFLAFIRNKIVPKVSCLRITNMQNFACSAFKVFKEQMIEPLASTMQLSVVKVINELMNITEDALPENHRYQNF